MHVTNVKVSFLREKQPAQYEKSAPAVELSAVLDEGEDHAAAVRALMTSAAEVVYNTLGFDVPPKVRKALSSGTVPAELSVATETAEVAPAASEAAEKAPEEAPEAAPEAEADKPRGRGRPKGSKNTAPKKETATAKRKREAAEAAAAEVPGEDDGVPGDEPTGVSTGEARVGPDDNPADHGVPGDDEVPGEETTGDPTSNKSSDFTPKELHTLIMEHVNATPRTLSVANAKQILAHFKVARAQDLTDEQALEGKAMVEKMVEAGKAS